VDACKSDFDPLFHSLKVC